jgi:hypothetical protein
MKSILERKQVQYAEKSRKSVRIFNTPVQTPNLVILSHRLPCIRQIARAGHDADDSKLGPARNIEILQQYQYC